MHCRHRRRPRCIRCASPLREALLVESRRAGNGAARPERCQERCDETVDVKQRHRVEADVLGPEAQRLGDVLRRRQQVALRQRHELGARSRARRVQQQGDRVGRSALVTGRAGVRTTDAERPARRLRHSFELDERKAEVDGERSGRSVERGVNRDGVRAEVDQRELELSAGVGGVERCTCCRGREPDKRSSRFRPVPHHECDPAVGRDATLAHDRAEASCEIHERRGRKRIPVRRTHDHALGRQPAAGLDETGEGRHVAVRRRDCFSLLRRFTCRARKSAPARRPHPRPGRSCCQYPARFPRRRGRGRRGLA